MESRIQRNSGKKKLLHICHGNAAVFLYPRNYFAGVKQEHAESGGNKNFNFLHTMHLCCKINSAYSHSTKQVKEHIAFCLNGFILSFQIKYDDIIPQFPDKKKYAVQ